MAVSAVKKETVKPVAMAADMTDVPAPKKSSSKLKLLLIALLTIGIVGGGAYWYFVKNAKGDKKEAHAEIVKPPQFVALDAFTVNLLMEETPQFLQIGLSLKVIDASAIEKIKLHMPEIRNRILLLLSSNKATTLLTVEGKTKLAADIATAINAILVPTAVKAGTKSLSTAAADTKPTDDADIKPATEGEDAPAESDEEPILAPVLPVLDVLFTSFIVH